ncbi:hypothetical protein QJS10_CPB21g00791 [Acorus calamus]|uniref:Translation initiation factor beta propellor-like domain-containing protein n=1 Tax=Acorus calamus TaxID=4465 RepID=A0AAV9C608_ACOCL|nr:hypothetical protein QJS10_CPB21g00791 [Acorus calamus]
MDLLCSAYADDSDGEVRPAESAHHALAPPPSKRPRTHGTNPILWRRTSPEAPPPPFVSRYVSKRERSILASAASSAPPPRSTVITSPVIGSISESDLPREILSSLKSEEKSSKWSRKVTGKLSVVLRGHTKAINAIQWSQSHAHLLASAGMDQTVSVWNVWSRNQPKARVFTYHNAAVKDVRWSLQGLSLLSCGYDCSSRLMDVEKGVETQIFKEDQELGTVRFHPNDPNLFLSGGLRGSLKLWDIRAGKVAREYRRSLGPILDVKFSPDAKHFISSSDTSRSRISENSIIVWDILREIPLSNQVYVEAYTCPCIQYHPYESCFVAQSNGNYIAIFSSRPPFKLDKYKRYEKHSVSGFPIKCDFSLDGEELASGSSDGSIYFYSYRSSELLRKIKAFEQPCVDIAFHPILPGVIASCSWAGEISVFE